jgi:hypothetical protein
MALVTSHFWVQLLLGQVEVALDLKAVAVVAVATTAIQVELH